MGSGPRLRRSRVTMASHHIFKVLFVNQGKVYEVYARKVSHGSLLGFVEIEELVFGIPGCSNHGKPRRDGSPASGRASRIGR